MNVSTVPVGTDLVNQATNSNHQIRIQYSSGSADVRPRGGNWTDASNGVGADAIVRFDPNHFATRIPLIYTMGSTGFYRETIPAHIILGHELIHAVRMTDGGTYCRRMNVEQWWVPEGINVRRSSIEELRTVGVIRGSSCSITENDLRQEHGLNPRIAGQ